MITSTKFNDPKHYQSIFNGMSDMSVPSDAVFALKADEKIVHNNIAFNTASIEQLLDFIDSTDIAIVEEVARSKYLTSLQILEFIGLRGINVKRHRLRKRILKLMRLRIIQENEIVIPNTLCGIKYYELDVKGYQIARAQGVCFHKGNGYLSFNKRKQLGIEISPLDIKKVLVGNQIVLGLMINHAKIQRFGILETLRAEGEGKFTNGCILRTTAYVKVNSKVILVYEVVRNCFADYEELADKVRRYNQILQNTEYLIGNHHGDFAYPQLIICGESLEQNKNIVQYLQSKGLWNSRSAILFTEDLLNVCDSLKSIYKITDSGGICMQNLLEY